MQSPKMIVSCTCSLTLTIYACTALESNTDVPKMEHVTERLLHEERKLKGKDVGPSNERASHGSRTQVQKERSQVLQLWKIWPDQEELQDFY